MVNLYQSDGSCLWVPEVQHWLTMGHKKTAKTGGFL